ncbi:MAG TPA: C40 family peptidase [Mycobacteriales bacterium]|jgi:cell wall-associated NlpC family hydrolase|nr:C40 family peptidase [Mycobacteriales bacterium]
MPIARRTASVFSRFAVLSALTVGLAGATTGIASADPTPPAGSGSGTTAGTGAPTEPGTPPTTDPADPADPSSGTSGEPKITYELPPAHIRSAASQTARERVRARHELQLKAVERVVHHQIGKPYVYGGAGPRAFDCSGLVRFVFGRAVDRWLPHNAAAQYHSVRHIKRRNLEVGDLVFQGGRNPFHVGIYAGHGKWWHAPHSGAHVRLQKIYRGHLVYGRVLTYRTAKHHKK